jgi:hypothetical protein
VLTAQEEFARKPAAVVWDGYVPEGVLSPLFIDDASVSRVFSTLPTPPRYDQPTAELMALDGLGILRPVDMLPEARSLPSRSPDCGYDVHAGQRRPVPLTAPTSARKQVVRVGYYNARTVPGTVTVDGRAVRVTFQQGLHFLYVVAPGPVATVELTVDATEVGAGFCATDVVVGQPWPKPAP